MGMTSIIPAVALFFVSLVLGRVIRLRGANWAIAWAGLEINLLAFVPLVLLDKGGQSVEAGVKYFLVQACGSALFLAGPLVANFEGLP